MKINKKTSWIKGKSYRKRILLKGLKGDINLVEEAVIEPGGEVPVHQHKFTKEIFFVTANSATMTVEKKRIKVKAGDLIQVNKGEKHGFINKSKKEFRLIVFKINFQKGDSYLE